MVYIFYLIFIPEISSFAPLDVKWWIANTKIEHYCVHKQTSLLPRLMHTECK